MEKTDFKKRVKEFKKEFPSLKEKVLLKDHTAWRMGGPAKYFLEIKNKDELEKAIISAKKINLPFFVLGGGSNILVSDKGFRGLIIKINNLSFEVEEKNGKMEILAGAGLSLGSLSAKLLKAQAGGMEWSSSIPGSLGGAVFGNAGAFGSCLSDSTEWIEALEVKNKKCAFKKYFKKDCAFSYRSSVFKKKAPNIIIFSVCLSLEKSKEGEISKKMKGYADFRKKRHPLDFPSAGSVFKNYYKPIKNKKLVLQFPELENFNQKKEIPAGWLIEKSGLKGKRFGKAQISEKHCNFFINLGGAKAKDMRALIKFAQKKVEKDFGIELMEEIIYLP
jgi:UDP-N-acetylmuramate dehydrogenase